MNSNSITYSCNTNNYDLNLNRNILCMNGFDKFRSPAMNARATKILSHKIFPDSRWTIWCDSNIWLRVAPETLLEYFDYPEVGIFFHPKRTTIEEEINACKLKGLDTNENLDHHRNHVGRLASTPIVIRKNTKNVQIHNNAWMSELIAGSHRDQLSFPYTLGTIAKYLEIPKIKGLEAYSESCNQFYLKIPHRYQILQQLKALRPDMMPSSGTTINLEKILNSYHQSGKWHLDGNFKVPIDEGEIFNENPQNN